MACCVAPRSRRRSASQAASLEKRRSPPHGETTTTGADEDEHVLPPVPFRSPYGYYLDEVGRGLLAGDGVTAADRAALASAGIATPRMYSRFRHQPRVLEVRRKAADRAQLRLFLGQRCHEMSPLGRAYLERVASVQQLLGSDSTLDATAYACPSAPAVRELDMDADDRATLCAGVQQVVDERARAFAAAIGSHPALIFASTSGPIVHGNRTGPLTGVRTCQYAAGHIQKKSPSRDSIPNGRNHSNRRLNDGGPHVLVQHKQQVPNQAHEKARTLATDTSDQQAEQVHEPRLSPGSCCVSPVESPERSQEEDPAATAAAKPTPHSGTGKVRMRQGMASTQDVTNLRPGVATPRAWGTAIGGGWLPIPAGTAAPRPFCWRASVVHDPKQLRSSTVSISMANVLKTARRTLIPDQPQQQQQSSSVALLEVGLLFEATATYHDHTPLHSTTGAKTPPFVGWSLNARAACTCPPPSCHGRGDASGSASSDRCCGYELYWLRHGGGETVQHATSEFLAAASSPVQTLEFQLTSTELQVHWQASGVIDSIPLPPPAPKVAEGCRCRVAVGLGVPGATVTLAAAAASQ